MMDSNPLMDGFDMAAMRSWAAGMQHVPFHAMSPLEPGGLGMWPTDAFACSCNGVTGPCHHHREQMRAQLMAMAVSASPQRQTAPTDTGFAKMSSRAQQAYPPLNEAAGDTGALAQRDANGYGSPHMEMHDAAPPARPPSAGSLGMGPSPSVASSTTSSLNMSPPLWAAANMGSRASFSQEHQGNTDASNDAQNAARFKAILEFVQAVGFSDFDSMVTAYYTGSFQKGSQAEAAQRVSRCRRLRKTLNSLHESAIHTWPAWEAQGYRDKITEAAQDLYIAEFETLMKGSARQRMSPPQHQMYMFGDMSPEPHYSHTGSHPVDLAQGGREDLQNLFRDKVRASSQFLITAVFGADGLTVLQVPNLWGLLTEVAATGTQGGQAGVVAAAALSLLCNASPSHATGPVAF